MPSTRQGRRRSRVDAQDDENLGENDAFADHRAQVTDAGEYVEEYDHDLSSNASNRSEEDEDGESSSGEESESSHSCESSSDSATDFLSMGVKIYVGLLLEMAAAVAPSVASTLPEDVLLQILGFVPTFDASTTCKRHLEIVEGAALKELDRIHEEHDLSELARGYGWRGRVPEKFHTKYYLLPPRLLLHCSRVLLALLAGLPPRLLLHCARTTPLSRYRTYHGPVAVLPDGNLAFACTDFVIRILDRTNGRCIRKGPMLGEIFSEIGMIGSQRLYYTKSGRGGGGYLVLVDNRGSYSDCGLYVLDLESLRFEHRMVLPDAKQASVAVDPEGDIYIAYRDGDEEDCFIASYDVKSLQQRLLVPQRTPGSPIKLCFSGHQLLAFRCVEGGTESHVFNRDLSVHRFLPCRDLGDLDFCCWANHRWVLYLSNAIEYKVISLNGDRPVDKVEDRTIPLGPAGVVFLTDTSIFVDNNNVEDHEDKEMQIYEFDIETLEKVRTIHTGLSNETHFVECVVSNDRELFYIVGEYSTSVNSASFILRFLL